MQITVLHNQSLLDVCLQHAGTIEGVFELAMANDLNITAVGFIRKGAFNIYSHPWRIKKEAE